MTPTQFYRKFAKLVVQKEWIVDTDGCIRKPGRFGRTCPLAFVANAVTGSGVGDLAVYPSADALKLSHASAQRIAGAADDNGYPRVRAKLLAAIGR